jgi:hypothetical protein
VVVQGRVEPLSIWRAMVICFYGPLAAGSRRTGARAPCRYFKHDTMTTSFGYLVRLPAVPLSSNQATTLENELTP